MLCLSWYTIGGLPNDDDDHTFSVKWLVSVSKFCIKSTYIVFDFRSTQQSVRKELSMEWSGKLFHTQYCGVMLATSRAPIR